MRFRMCVPCVEVSVWPHDLKEGDPAPLHHERFFGGVSEEACGPDAVRAVQEVAEPLRIWLAAVGYDPETQVLVIVHNWSVLEGPVCDTSS